MILWVNLATASLPALALGVEPASRHIMEHPPMRVKRCRGVHLARCVIFQGVFIAALALVAFVIGQNAGSYELGCTMAFGVLGFSQVLRSLNQRSATDPVWDREGARNRQLGLAAAASIALMLVVLLVPPFIEAFGGTTMDLGQWALVVGFALLSVVQTEIAKAIEASARRQARVAGAGILAGTRRGTVFARTLLTRKTGRNARTCLTKTCMRKKGLLDALVSLVAETFGDGEVAL